MHYRLLNPTKYLGAADLLGAEPTYKILRVVMEGIEEEAPKGGAPLVKQKGMVYLEGQPKGWLLCVTTAKALATMFGDESEKWTGHSVTLFGDMVKSFGDMVPAVRVRGSPELASTLSYIVKRRKKADTFSLVKTGAAKPAASPKPAAPPDPAKAELIRVRMAIKELLKANDMAGDVALAFVQRITGKASRHDANDLGLIQTALAAPPPSAAPPPPGEDDIPF